MKKESNLIRMLNNHRKKKLPKNAASKDVRKLMNFIRQQGRDGDTELAHVNPQEQNLLKMIGGSGTKNPKTGLKEFRGGIFRKPLKALKSVVGGGAGAILGNMVLPGVGGIIGGALGQGAQNAIRGKDIGQGALKGAGMGAVLPSVASGLGGIAGGGKVGNFLTNYGNKNAILPSLGLGGKAAGVAAGDSPLDGIAKNLENMESKHTPTAVQVASGASDKGWLESLKDNTKDFVTSPKNLLSLAAVGGSIYGHMNQEKTPKPKSGAELGLDAKQQMLAQRLTPQEMAEQEAYNLEMERAKRRIQRKKFLPEEAIGDIPQLYSKVSTPEEYRLNNRWLTYYDDPAHTQKTRRF